MAKGKVQESVVPHTVAMSRSRRRSDGGMFPPPGASRPAALTVLGAALVVSLAGLALFCSHGTWVGARFVRPAAILVPVGMGGREARFLLDTGSERTLVSPAMSSALEPAGKTHQVLSGPCGDATRAEVFRSGTIRFAGSRLRYPEEVNGLDLARLAEIFREDLGGVLGWDVLHGFVVGFDASRERMVAGRKLEPAKALEMLEPGGPSSRIPFRVLGNVPVIDVRVGAQTLHLILDTASTSTILSPKAWERIGPPGELVPGPPARTVGGTYAAGEGRLDEILLGSLRVKDVQVRVPDPVPCAAGSEATTDGMVGMDLLSRFVTVIDGPGEALLLAPGSGGG